MSNLPDTAKITLWVDADACPVKEEIYKVAYRTDIPVRLVANQSFRIPRHPLVTLTLVSDSFDAADDYIAEHASPAAIVITSDILLADRCLKAGAQVLKPNGTVMTDNSIGSAVATRAIMADLRGGIEQVGYTAPFSKADRSQFLQALDTVINKVRRMLA